MPALLDDFKAIPANRIGGLVDYQNANSVINGGATKAQNVRYSLDTAATRYGTRITMQDAESGADANSADCLTVLGQTNPGEVPIVFDSNGNMFQESPVGSGTLVPISPPLPLPSGAFMGSTKGNNNLYACFRKGNDGQGIAVLYNGPGLTLSPVSQNPIGSIWTPGRYAFEGDAVRTSQNPSRWFRCIIPGLMGSAEPSWPLLDGYIGATASPTTGIISISTVIFRFGSVLTYQAKATVNGTSGFTVGASINVSGNSSSGFNGTWVVAGVGTNLITWNLLANTPVGTGGSMIQTSGLSPINMPALASDPNGPSQWIEWTPGAQQFVPAPEAPTQILSIKGQLGAPVGTISSGQDVYVCFAFQNQNGESAWTVPIVFTNTASTDVLEVYFQKQNDNPGPTVAPAFNAAGYGGPRMPNWLLSVLGLSDPVVSWPTLNSLNIYVASVATGAAAPQGYYQYASGAPVFQPAVISSIPSSGTVFIQRIQPTAALDTVPFTGASGSRYLAVERLDVNGSLVPIDPGSPLLVNFTSSIAPTGVANIDFIQRSGNVVTCTVDLLAGFTQSAEVVVSGVTDPSFNGSFQLTGVSPNQFGGATLIWDQTGDNGSSDSGTATSASGASAFVTPQILIATAVRATNVVTAVVNSLQGIEVGTEITVAGVADPTFNSSGATPFFTITNIIANNGGGGTLTWNQTAGNASSTGGTIAPTGAGAGNNAVQSVGFIVRNQYPASPGTVLAIVFDPSGKATQPPPGYVPGGSIVVQNMTDSSFDGTFTINNVQPNPGKGGGWGVGWTQSGANAKINGPAGTVTLLTGGPIQYSRGNVTAIARATNIVTVTLDTVANFVVGGSVNVTSVLNSSFDGNFTVTSVNTGSNQLQWTQTGPDATSSGGLVAGTFGGTQQPAPVVILPPGGQFIAQDIASFSTQGAQQAGPFNFIPQQNPVTPFTAKILSIGAVNGAVTALLSSTAGLQPGNTIQVQSTTNDWFDGVFVLAEVNGNTVEWAGNGPGTGFAGGTLSLIPTQPTVALGQNTPVPITTMTRTAAGIVAAVLADVTNLAAGMKIQVSGASDGSFNGLFIVQSVQQFPNLLSGVVTWQSATLAAVSAMNGFLQGLPGVLVNFSDTYLASAFDVTQQLNALPSPPTPSDLQFIEQYNMMAYIDNDNYPSSIVWGNVGDPANVTGSSGDPQNQGSNIQTINTNSGSETVCVREIKDGPVICLKTDGGYQVSNSAALPSEWSETERWDKFGPPSARLVAVGPDFLVFVHQTGMYAYVLGRAGLFWVTEKISGSGSWSRVNWPVTERLGWIAVNAETREVHLGLSLDGSPTINYKLTVNYFGGWEQPEDVNRYGKLITPRDCVKISLDPFAATCGQVLTRTLASADARISSRQMTYGLPGSVLYPSGPEQNIIMASRAGGLVTLTLPLGGAAISGTIIVSGVEDDSFNGTFPATFAVGVDNNTCTYNQAGLDSNSAGGSLVLGVSQLAIVMEMPDVYDDYGNGIDSRYRPWLWQNSPRMLKVGGYRIAVRGNGYVFVTPASDDDTQSFDSQKLKLPESPKLLTVERGLRVPDQEYMTLEISNGAVPGQWFELNKIDLCVNEMGTRRG